MQSTHRTGQAPNDGAIAEPIRPTDEPTSTSMSTKVRDPEKANAPAGRPQDQEAASENDGALIPPNPASGKVDPFLVYFKVSERERPDL